MARRPRAACRSRDLKQCGARLVVPQMRSQRRGAWT
jgi:hypothetical protein